MNWNSLSPKSISRRFKVARRKFHYIITSPYRFFKTVCFYVGFAVVTCTFFMMVAAYIFWSSLPDLGQMKYAQLKSVAQKRVAKKLEESGKKHYWTDITKINRNYIYTIVLSEDATFFEHNGINVDAIINSLVENLRKKKYEHGASTISQQVVKNVFLSDEKTIMRKIKELLITDRLEKYFTKNEILEIYLNVAEFGPDIYGVGAASFHYFNKTPDKVSVPEGAFIAIMLPSPRKYHFSVFENQNITDKKKRKIRRIIGDMMAKEFISPQQYKDFVRYDYFMSNSRKPAKSRYK